MTKKGTPTCVVVGCGLMGCDIAAIFLAAGWRVVAITADHAKREERLGRVRRSLSQLEAEAGGTQDDAISFVEAPEAVIWTGVELVVESVPEIFDLKRSLFVRLDHMVPAHIPIATNTSGMRISEISAGCATAHRMAGLHFFLPAHLVPAVEVVKGEATDPAICDRLASIMRSVGRKPIRVQKDVPGFLANRIQHALMREAFAILDEGLGTPEDIDVAVRYGFGFRYVAAGPLLQKEMAGLDTQLAAARSIYPALSSDSVPSRTLLELVGAGRKGMKSGQGFWTWSDEEGERERARYEATLLQALKLLKENASLPAQREVAR